MDGGLWRAGETRRRIRVYPRPAGAIGKEQGMSHFDADALVAARIAAAASRAGQLSRRTVLKHGAALGAGLAGFSALQHSVAAAAANRLRAANILAQSGELR